MENRSERIVLKVTPNMMERINKIADRMQINSTSLCSTWISEKVDSLEQQTKLQEGAVEQVVENIFRSIDKADTELGIYKIRKLLGIQQQK